MTVFTRKRTWQVVWLYLLVAMLGMWANGFALDLSHMFNLTTIIAALGMVAAFGVAERPATRFGRFLAGLECSAQAWLIGSCCAVLSYVIASGTTGYHDALLAGGDHALGFDWVALYEFTLRHRALINLGYVAYLSIFLTPIVVIFGLSMNGMVERARAYIGVSALCLAVTLVIFAFLPARSALVHYVGGNPRYVSTTGIHHVAIIDALRAGTLRTIDPTQLAGLITFPSAHMITALLLIWAGWPVPHLRSTIVAVNVAMILATPVEGTHYLVDLLGGTVVVLIVLGLLYRSQPRPALGTPGEVPASGSGVRPRRPEASSAPRR